MLNKLVILLSFIAITNLSAAVPTLEGLLRNPSNKEVAADTVSLAYRIMEDRQVLLAGVGGKDGPVASDEYLYQKIYWRIQDNRVDSVVVLTSKDQTFGEKSLLSVKEMSGKEFISKSSARVENALLVGILNIISLNNPDFMLRLIKNTNSEIKLNRELINRESDDYLRKYRDANSNKDSKKSKSEDDPYSVQNLNRNLSARYYNFQENLRLTRSGDSFVWLFESDKFHFEFDNYNYKLKRMNFVNMEENLSFKFGDYVLFNGQHELPKYIVMQKGEAKKYKIDLLEYKNQSFKPSDFSKRITKLKEIQAARKETMSESLYDLPQL